MSITIYHNPRCGKSREALGILQEKNIDFTTKLYLQDTPKSSEIKSILKKLEGDHNLLIRKKEPLFKEHYNSKDFNDNEILEILISHPALMERPLIVTDDKAVIARPSSVLNDIL